MALIIRSIRCGAVISGAYSPSDSAATSTAGSCPRAMATMDSIITCKSSASRSFFVSGYTLCVSATAPAAIAFQSLSLISTPAKGSSLSIKLARSIAQLRFSGTSLLPLSSSRNGASSSFGGIMCIRSTPRPLGSSVMCRTHVKCLRRYRLSNIVGTARPSFSLPVAESTQSIPHPRPKRNPFPPHFGQA